MNEYRGFPRLFPRPGGRVSVTIGDPITDKIRPLVDRWRDLASREVGTLGIGGEWTSSESDPPNGGSRSSLDPTVREAEDSRQRIIRGSGGLAGGEEESVRKDIVALLQEEVAKLGQRVEAKEGRFQRGEWSHSRRNEQA